MSRLLPGPSGRRARVFPPRYAVLSFALPFAVLAGFWALLIRPFYFPSRDEIALLVNSAAMFHPSVAAWFLEGYSRYFIGYPGLSQHATDFIRPVANAAYYVSSLLFGTHWSWYLLMPYAVQAGLVCLSVKLAVEAAGLPLRRAWLVGLLVLISPAFGWEQMYFASFGLDLLGALFVLAALHELWHGRYATAWMLMLAGVFTKETTLFAPVVTALLVWLSARPNSSFASRLGRSLVWLVPVFAWAIVRSVAFHGHAGIYVFKGGGLGAQAANVLHGFLAWPFGTRTLQQPLRFRLLFFPLNGLFWVGCAAVFYRFFRRPHSQAETRIPGVLPAVLLYTAGALAMPVLLNLPQRFGASFFPLFLLLLGTLAYSAAYLTLRRAASICLAVAALAALYQKHIEPTTLRDTRAQWALASSYIEQIHASRAPYLLVVNDASGGFTSPALIARFAGYPGTLVRANNVEGLSFDHCAEQPALTQVRRGPDHLQLTSNLAPACSFYAFDSVPPEALSSTAPVASYNDDELSLRASLPDLTPPPSGGTPQMFGTLTTDAQWHTSPPSLLVPLFNELRYQQIP